MTRRIQPGTAQQQLDRMRRKAHEARQASKTMKNRSATKNGSPWCLVTRCSRVALQRHHAFCSLCWRRLPAGFRDDVSREARECVGWLYTFALRAAVDAATRRHTYASADRPRGAGR